MAKLRGYGGGDDSRSHPALAWPTFDSGGSLFGSLDDSSRNRQLLMVFAKILFSLKTTLSRSRKANVGIATNLVGYQHSLGPYGS
jgi:hypothetical protein